MTERFYKGFRIVHPKGTMTYKIYFETVFIICTTTLKAAKEYIDDEAQYWER